MREIIGTNRELCVGCNRCVRECPIELANVTYQDETGGIKVKVDHTKCIACGRCIFTCKHKARYYEDDTGRFFDDLSRGIPISLIAAPSIRINIPNWKNLFTYLKKLGVNKIYDVSLGADICIWAHIRYIEQFNKPLITQPCPTIVSYCEIYRHDLLKNLSPIHSPMACSAVYMRDYEGIHDRIAALSPCIAKSNELEKTKTMHYNITFAKLHKYIEENNVSLPEEETGFDHHEGGMGSIFPTPGGLKENIEFFLGTLFPQVKKPRIDRAEGKEVYSKLEIFSKTPRKLQPQIYDVLNCEGGCNLGSGCLRSANIFAVDSEMANRRKSVKRRGREHFESLYKTYDRIFELTHFIRQYRPIHTPFLKITDADIQEAFTLLDKTDYTKQNFDCGACGSNTCYHMARKIALKINIPINCIVKSRDTAIEEHKKNLIAYQENIQYTGLIQDALDRFETIWENVDCGISIIDAYTKEILDINPLAARMFGDDKEKIIGKKCHKLICPAEESSCPIMDLNQVVDHSERKFIKATGEVIPIIKSVAKIQYNGRLALLESFADISHLKKAEEQMRLLKITEQANRAKSDFLSRMSHEIRTPMNAIIGMTKIAEGSKDIAKLKYCISMIENSSMHLLGLINDILDMSKIESGKFELDNAPMNIEKILVKICNLLIEKIEQKNIKFSIIWGKDMKVHYIGDELRLSQVITNLMSNAVKFTPDNGKINLSVDEIRRKTDYSILHFVVEDTGIGMTKGQIDRLFNAFEQADGSISRQFGGTGLGLAISKNIIEKMEGSILVESELGKGSRFSFDVKLKRSEQQSGPVIFGNICPSDIKALIVDSDKESREYFKLITNKLGINADEAESGEAALLLMEISQKAQKPYDIIFLDYSLPDMNPVESIGSLSGKTDKNTVIVVITSFLKWHEIEKKANSMGIEKFITKPLFPSVILDLINESIGERAKKLDIRKTIVEEKPDFSHVSVLLAEDVEVNREIFITLFEDTKINIDIAENGAVTVEKFKATPEKYNLILMDVQMPEMDGYEATRIIRSLNFEKAKSIPIIAMTANAFKEDVEKCIESGMNDHLSKPIDVNAVNEKILLYCKK